MTQSTLVIGGTGPTGPLVVNGLIERGHHVAICHTGAHEVDEIPPFVEHIHTDPFDRDALADALGSRQFDLVVAMYGRLRGIAELMMGRTGRLVTVGGFPALRGYMDPDRWQPPGLPVPTRDDAPTADGHDDHKSHRVARTEAVLFELHPEATHFRYPYVYGPRQLVPREWPVVRRILDDRPFIIVPDGGLTLKTVGFVENLAHALLLAVDRPDAARGEIFNAADETNLTIHQTVDIIAETLEHDWEVVSMPWELAAPARPLIQQPRTTHRMLGVDKLRHLLGYRDVVPAPEALARSVRWLVANPPERGGEIEQRLEDPFDYRAEDQLVAWWRETLRTAPTIDWQSDAPGLTAGYRGPGTTNPPKP